jgi:hypothetical protein
MFSTTGKKRGPKKWVSAEAKKIAQIRQAEWDHKLIQFEKMAPKFSTGPYNTPKKSITSYLPKTPPGRETAYIPSQDTGWVTCVKPEDTEYTGEKCLGISVLHKSNGIPVFSQEEVISISKMRR